MERKSNQFKNLLILLLLILISCSKSTTKVAAPVAYGAANIDARLLEQDFMKWWSYFNKDVILSTDFVPLDTSLAQIPKEAFLEKLTSGLYIPIQLNSKDANTYLQLYALTEKVADDIASTMKMQSTLALSHYKMEGLPFPDFDFKNLEGKVYNPENTKDKFLIIKCWFIACKACVEEFPELNELVKKYQDRTDLEFISLAFDSEEALRKFLQKKEFDYATVAVDRSFIQKQLNVNHYPTHLIVDQKGIIKKVVNSFKELEMALPKEI